MMTDDINTPARAPDLPKYANRSNGKICVFVSEDDGIVAFKPDGSDMIYYLGRAEFDRRFQPWSEPIATPTPSSHVCSSKDQALRTAISHLEHMARWIGAQQAGYSLESLGEDMAWIKSALSDLAPDVELVEAARGLKRIVEGINGAMNNGTWRDDHGHRLKDTPEWINLYNALAATNGAPEPHVDAPQPCGIADPSTRDCANMKEVGGGMDGERYRCDVCGKGYFLDYEEMK